MLSLYNILFSKKYKNVTLRRKEFDVTGKHIKLPILRQQFDKQKSLKMICCLIWGIQSPLLP